MESPGESWRRVSGGACEGHPRQQTVRPLAKQRVRRASFNGTSQGARQLCPVLCAPCPVPNAQCRMPNAQCP
eukprot:4230042-Alexandrium_andersonii.AAC.1